MLRQLATEIGIDACDLLRQYIRAEYTRRFGMSANPELPSREPSSKTDAKPAPRRAKQGDPPRSGRGGSSAPPSARRGQR